MLMLGGHGTFEVTLRCLIERQGMKAVVGHWTSKNLKSEVGFSTVLFNFSLLYLSLFYFCYGPTTPIRFLPLLYCHFYHDVVTPICHVVAVSAHFLGFFGV